MLRTNLISQLFLLLNVCNVTVVKWQNSNNTVYSVCHITFLATVLRVAKFNVNYRNMPKNILEIESISPITFIILLNPIANKFN